MTFHQLFPNFGGGKKTRNSWIFFWWDLFFNGTRGVTHYLSQLFVVVVVGLHIPVFSLASKDDIAYRPPSNCQATISDLNFFVTRTQVTSFWG